MKTRWPRVLLLISTLFPGITIGADLEGPWQLLFPRPSDAYLQSIAYGNGRFVAVGGATTLASTNGVTWTNFLFGITNEVTAVTYGDGNFLAVGLSSTVPIWSPLVAISRDGFTWTPHFIDSFRERLIGVAHGGGIYAAISQAGIWISQDGLTWAPEYAITNSQGPLATPLQAITYADGRFVVVGQGISVTSTDSLSWISHPTGTGETMTGVAFAENVFVAVGAHGTVFNSSDGANWISTAPVGTNQITLLGVSSGSGRFVAFGHDASASLLLTSTNGRNWFRGTIPTTLDIAAITYGEGQFVAVGEPSVILTSPDGELWTNQAAPYFSVEGVAYGKSTFVATAFDKVLTSLNGVNWASHSVAVPPRLGDVAFRGDRFFSLSKGIKYNPDTINGFVTSIDGTNWVPSMVWTNGNTTTTEVSLPAFGRNLYVAAGNYFDSAAKIYSAYSFTSTDGLAWERHEINTQADLLQIVYANDQFVAVGRTGDPGVEVFTSVDGATWNRIWRGSAESIWGSLAFGNGTFVTATMGGFLVSHNGGPWRDVNPGFDRLIYDVAYGDGLFVASGAAGFVLTSEDGDNWKIHNIGTYNWLLRCTFANGKFIAASDYALYQSESPVFPSFHLVAPRFLAPGSIQIGIDGTMGQNWETQVSTDLQHWTPLAFGFSTNTSAACLDTNGVGVANRFYRAVLR